MLFIPVYLLVQDMLSANRDFGLPRLLSKLGATTNMAMSAHIAQLMIPRIKPKTNALQYVGFAGVAVRRSPLARASYDYNNERLYRSASRPTCLFSTVFEGVL